MEDLWIQGSVKHKGRVREYLHRVYGGKAFDKEGDIRIKYLKMATKRAMEERDRSLEEALVEARTLIKLAKRKRRKMLIKV